MERNASNLLPEVQRNTAKSLRRLSAATVEFKDLSLRLRLRRRLWKQARTTNPLIHEKASASYQQETKVLDYESQLYNLWTFFCLLARGTSSFISSEKTSCLCGIYTYGRVPYSHPNPRGASERCNCELKNLSPGLSDPAEAVSDEGRYWRNCREKKRGSNFSTCPVSTLGCRYDQIRAAPPHQLICHSPSPVVCRESETSMLLLQRSHHLPFLSRVCMRCVVLPSRFIPKRNNLVIVCSDGICIIF